jgi:hypothetical protein
MAKVNYLFEFRQDYTNIRFFKNQKNSDAKKEELLQDEDFAENIKDDVEKLLEGSVSYSKGLAVMFGDVGGGEAYDLWDGAVFKDMSEDEFNAIKAKHIEASFPPLPSALMLWKRRRVRYVVRQRWQNSA